MSFSTKNTINTIKYQRNVFQKTNNHKDKKINGPINVKMCQIPNNTEFNNKIKANVITSSYFNLNLKNKSNLILNKEIIKSKKLRNNLTNDIKTNYYSLIISNNRNSNKSNNISNNYSKLSINSLLSNTINYNNQKKINNHRNNNLINEDCSIINKQKNYSFKIKVNRIKEKLISDNSRNNSIKKNYNSNSNNDIENTMPQKIINNISDLRNKTRNKIKTLKIEKNQKNRKNHPIKSVFNKIDLNNYKHNKTNFISYSEKDKTNRLKRKIINSSCLKNNVSSFNILDKTNKLNEKKYFKIHVRNYTASCNAKVFEEIFNNKKTSFENENKSKKLINYDSSLMRKNVNQTNILNNLNIENIKIKNKLVISPKIKYGTNIIKNDFSYIKNYNSISENINKLKNILSKNDYNSNDNFQYNKKKLLKEIPVPTANKNYNKIVNKKGNNINNIKEIIIKKINNNKPIQDSRNKHIIIKKNKTSVKLKEEKNIISINRNKDNYDRDDDIVKENINKENIKNNKLNINEILRKNKNKSFVGKKIKSIKIERKNTNKNNKNKKYIITKKNYSNCNSYNNLNKNKNDYNYTKKINAKLVTKIDEEKEKRNAHIENTLFFQNNLSELSPDNDDKFDDLYSIIKKINFNSVLLNKNGIFSNESKEFKDYSLIFNKYFFTSKSNMKKYIKYSDKSKSKNYTQSTKMNTTSSKKGIVSKNEIFVREFKLEDI